MLNPRKTLTELYPKKLGKNDLIKAKNFVERHANGSVARSIFSWVLDGLTTLVNFAVSPLEHPVKGTVNFYEFQEIPRGFMEQFGNEIGLLAHNLSVGAPSMYSLPLGVYGIEHLVKKRLENYNNDSDGKMAKVQRYLQKHITSTTSSHIFSNFVMDFHSFLKYNIAASNLDLLLQNSNMPGPLQKTLYYVMWTPYVASLVSYYWKKFDTTENSKKLGTVLKKELQYVGKKLFEGYGKVAYKLGERVKSLNSR